MDLDLSGLKVNVSDGFLGEWGSGRRHVTSEMFSSVKKSVEDLSVLPSMRADEPPIDAFKVLLGKEFKYSFLGVLSKKRLHDDGVLPR